ncbi:MULTISPECIES: hypothetical protein [unclassified Streptomyces]|nr:MULTISPECIES: hypothetical protein [unclassified Streptomyces]MDF3148840.1 hypothetical protein [Streptomyces sp. T21Q-yed]WDF38965.1 hypothetical protein PBV52_20255 [Streptomyces sp. T12]
MKRRVVAALAVAIAGLMLSAVPAAAQAGHGEIGRDEWNFFITNVHL